MLIKLFPLRAPVRVIHVTTPALSCCLSCLLRACHDSDHESTTILENTCFEWNGPFNDIGMGVTDYACVSDPMVDAGRTAVVASDRTGLERDAGPDREDRSSDICHVGDTRLSFYEDAMTASCTLIISAEQHERLSTCPDCLACRTLVPLRLAWTCLHLPRSHCTVAFPLPRPRAWTRLNLPGLPTSHCAAGFLAAANLRGLA